MPTIKHYLEFGLFKIIETFFSPLPRTICLWWGKILGLTFFYLDQRHRILALSNLKMALGKDCLPLQLKKIARDCFIHFGQVIMEFIKFPRLTPHQKKKLVSVQGATYLKKALAQGKGALLFSAHYGNWEIAPYFISTAGRIKVIARVLDNPLLEKEVLKIRSSFHSTVIHKNQAVKNVLRSLKKNQIIAILIDQNVLRDQAVFVDFFGKKAATTPSLAFFHLKTRAPVLPVFCYPTPSHHYILKINPPLETHLCGEFSKDTLKITQQCTKIIESQIKKELSYWLWFHNRWKTRPQTENR